MIKIPAKDKKFSQPNTSDMFGNLWYTKNINLDEEGYIKLSPRTVSIVSQEDNADVGRVTSFGRNTSGFYAVGSNDALLITSTPTSLSTIADPGASCPTTFSDDSNGVYWQNRWYATTATALWYKTISSGAWTNTGITFSNTADHTLEVFRNKESLCVSDGNTVKLINTSHSVTVTLTIPADYEIIGLSFNKDQIGITTKLSDVADSQNQEAYFFTWDGGANLSSSTALANSGYPVGSDTICGITPYKSSWVLLTRSGELKYFNGAGFQTLATLPFYYQNMVWGDSGNREMFGDSMQVDGEVIYINISAQLNTYGKKHEEYLVNYPTGILCYDPKVGIYHRYAPSISKASMLTVTDANVDITNNILTKTAGTIPETGNPVKYTSQAGAEIGGLVVEEVYYITKLNSTQFKLATTRQNAIDAINIDITSTGSTNNYFLALDLVDFGANKAGRTGAVALTGKFNALYENVIFSGDYTDSNSIEKYETICLSVDGFENRGYFVTPKISSDDIEDNNQKCLIKHRPLNTGDSIIVKYKDRDVIGIPVSTPQSSIRCSWTDSNTFTTTADLLEVYAFINSNNGECECEITAGAGAGQMAQISSISYLSGTYTVNLAEEILGAASGNYCDIIIDNWKKIGEITSSNSLGYQEFPIEKPSKWLKIKVELRGVDVAIEELQILNKSFKKLQ